MGTKTTVGLTGASLFAGCLIFAAQTKRDDALSNLKTWLPSLASINNADAIATVTGFFIIFCVAAVILYKWLGRRGAVNASSSFRDIRDYSNEELAKYSINLAGRIRILSDRERQQRADALHGPEAVENHAIAIQKHMHRFLTELNQSLGPKARVALRELRERTGVTVDESRTVALDGTMLAGPNALEDAAQTLERLSAMLGRGRDEQR